MKCERCGNQLDDTDLFCQKCGKAVFEEYMDDDDIWEEYDREPPKKKTKAQKKSEIVEEKTKEEIKEEKTEPKQQIVEQPEPKKEPQKNKTLSKESSPKKKSPLGLICACVLIVCLLVGVLWGALTVKQMDAKEKEETKTTLKNNQEQENQSSSSSENTKTEETVKPEETKEEETKTEETKTEETKPEEQEQVTEAKPEEVKKQDYFVMVDKDGIDFNQFTKLAVTNAEQSSMASSDSYDYSANSAVDGDITSSWQEGVDGLGEGTGIKLTLDGTHKIRYMVLYLGNWRSDEMWQKNARPAKLSINLGDNQAKDVEFSDEKKAFCLSFDEPVEASFVSLYIEAGYAGSKWNDNCISEVELYE